MFNNFKISLKLKFALIFTLLVIVMMGAVTYIFTIRELNLRVEQVKLRMEKLAQNIATIRSVETEDWDVYQMYINNQLTLNTDIVYVAIFNEQNELKAHSLNLDWLDVGSNQTLTKLDEISIVLRLEQRQLAEESQKDLESKSVNIIIGEQNLGTVKVGFSLIELNDEMRANLYRNFELAIIFVILSIIASYFISQKIVKPLGKLTQAMLKISQGDLNQEIHIDSRDEIGEMAETFNFMTRGLQEKELIENFSRELGFTIELGKIAQLITKRLIQALNARQGVLFFREKGQASEFNSICSYPEPLKRQVSISRNKSLCQYFLKIRTPFLLADLKSYSKFITSINIVIDSKNNTLIFPIIINEEVIGLFLLNPKNENVNFTESEILFLNTLIGQAGMAIENALLLNELTEQERLKRELEIARTVQNSLLPQSNPEIAGLDIDGLCIPATEIGGDYFDFFPLDNHTLGIAIADVTGKGTSAAFYMAVVKGIMLSLTPIFSSPQQLLCELNRSLFGTMDRKIFVTMIYGIFDIKKNKLTFARAGDNALIVKNKQNSKVESLTPLGIGLGLEEGIIFDKTISEQEVKFKPGDTFLFYTDGISEAMNLKRQEFGEDRLENIISQTNKQKSSNLREIIINEVNNFVQGAPQHDDITMVTVMATK